MTGPASAAVVPVGKLRAGRGLPSTEALVLVVKTRVGLPPNLTGDGRKVDVPAAGKDSPWVAPCCNRGRVAADTNFVMLDTKEGLRDPTNRMLLGDVMVSAGNPTGGGRTAKGGLKAGTGQGVLGRGEMGEAATLGATETGLGPVGGAAAAAGTLELPVLGGISGGGAWPEMMSTWLPGPRPCGGTTKRALLRRICVPAAR